MKISAKTKKPTFDDMQRLLTNLILPFYEIERDMPMPIQNHRNETDAEHSWSLAIAACALAPQIDPKLDVGKICQFAVVHDLVELYAGDVSVWASEDKIAAKHEREQTAAKKIRKNFSQFPWLANTIEEYEKKDSSEALFVYALDRFMALLVLYKDQGYYYLRDKRSKADFDKKHISYRYKSHAHKGVGQYYDQLIKAFDEHPEYFYNNNSKV